MKLDFANVIIFTFLVILVTTLVIYVRTQNDQNIQPAPVQPTPSPAIIIDLEGSQNSPIATPIATPIPVLPPFDTSSCYDENDEVSASIGAFETEDFNEGCGIFYETPSETEESMQKFELAFKYFTPMPSSEPELYFIRWITSGVDKLPTQALLRDPFVIESWDKDTMAGCGDETEIELGKLRGFIDLDHLAVLENPLQVQFTEVSVPPMGYDLIMIFAEISVSFNIEGDPYQFTYYVFNEDSSIESSSWLSDQFPSPIGSNVTTELISTRVIALNECSIIFTESDIIQFGDQGSPGQGGGPKS